MRRLAIAVVSLALCLNQIVVTGQVAPAGHRVEIRQARTMKPLKVGGAMVMRLIDSVILEHEGTLLYCDSAYVYQENNSFDAYGKVRIEGEGNLIEGSALYYMGATREGRMVGQPVLMVDKESGTRLWTDFLFFNTEANSAYFVSGGRVESPDYRVQSQRGFYASSPARITFAGQVVIRGKDVNLLGDSVEMYRNSGELHFFHATRLYQDSAFLYGDKGVYYRDARRLSVHSNVLFRRGGNTLYSDSLDYDQQLGYGLALGRAVVVDSSGDARLYGRRLEIWQREGRALATRDPLLYSVDTASVPADTIYMRADTLYAWRDTVHVADGKSRAWVVDSVWSGRALYDVRAYSNGQQVVADSMLYDGKGRRVTLYRAPAPYVWMRDMQAYAKSVVFFLGEERADSVWLEGDAFVAQREGVETYNQINGQRMYARLDSTGVRFVRVREEGQVLFFMRDKGSLIGVNRVVAPGFNVWMRDSEIQNVTFYSKPTSRVLPYKDVEMEDRILPNFAWNEALRPKLKEDVVPRWVQNLTFYVKRRERVALFEALDRAILALPWEAGVSRVQPWPSMPDGAGAELGTQGEELDSIQ